MWTVTLRFDGVRNPNHGPVSTSTNERLTWASVMFCGNWPGGNTEMTLVANYEQRADAVLAAMEEANRYAAEIGIAAQTPEVDATPVGSAALTH